MEQVKRLWVWAGLSVLAACLWTGCESSGGGKKKTTVIDVAGIWNVTITYDEGDNTQGAQMNLVQTGTTFTGESTSNGNDDPFLISGVINGTTWSATFGATDADGETGDLVGTVAGDTITGTIEVSVDGEVVATGTFVATRV